MDVRFLGMIGPRELSEIHAPSGPELQPDYVRDIARAHERSGFDRVLVGYGSSTPEGTQMAAYAASQTSTLGFLIAHRPGVAFPTLTARTFATLDQFTGGRIAIHMVTGGAEADLHREGDYESKDDRYRRTGEYIDVLRQAWSATEPVDHDGEFYRFEGFRSDVRPYADRVLPIFFGGSSPAAYRVGGARADVFMLWGEPLQETREQIESVRAAAVESGRPDVPEFSVSFRPILGDTEDAAWQRAHRILDTIRESGGGKAAFVSNAALVGGHARPESVASQRLLDAAAKGELHDRALWTPTAAATNAAGNTTALVGTPATVAEAIADYAEIGVSQFLIRGFDPLADAEAYGELVSRSRAAIDRRLAAVVA